MPNKVNSLIEKLGPPLGLASPNNDTPSDVTPLYDEAQLKKLAELMINEFQDILRANRGADTGTLSYRIEDHFKD